MIFIEMLFALAVSMFLTVVFAVFGRQAKTPRRVFVFGLIVFFGAWAGGVWLTPVGPAVLGVYWLTFFAVGLIFALVMEAFAAFAKPPSGPSPSAAQEEAKEEREIESVMWIFFWILVGAFLAAILLGYVRRMTH